MREHRVRGTLGVMDLFCVCQTSPPSFVFLMWIYTTISALRALASGFWLMVGGLC